MNFFSSLTLAVLTSATCSILIMLADIDLPLWVHFMIGLTCGIAITSFASYNNIYKGIEK